MRAVRRGLRRAMERARRFAAVGLRGDSLVAVPASGQVLYRLVWRVPARERDFMSQMEKGRPPHKDSPAIYWTGVSMFRERSQAVSRARGKGSAVARVTLRPEEGFHLAKTLNEGHYTVWGLPDRLLANCAIV
jgi:hypothetical protein